MDLIRPRRRLTRRCNGYLVALAIALAHVDAEDSLRPRPIRQRDQLLDNLISRSALPEIAQALSAWRGHLN